MPERRHTDPAALEALQRRLADIRPEPLRPADVKGLAVAGCFVCFPRGGTGRGAAGDPAWAAAALTHRHRVVDEALVEGEAGAPYEPGLLAMREGALLERAVRALGSAPDVLLVNAGGADHPRGAGLALQLGWALDLPSIGVTDRPLLAEGDRPGPRRGDQSPLYLHGREVARHLTTRTDTRPLVVHAGWRTDLDLAVAIVLASTRRARTPTPLRAARSLARRARDAAQR